MSSSLAGRSGFSRTAGTGVAFQNGIENHSRAFAAERQCPGRHFVEHRTEREQIRAGVQFLGSHLLRRHVGHRAQRRARTGQVLLAHRRRLRRSAAAFWLAELADGVTFASPKSRILACPRLVTKMLAGLMSRWTMPSAWAASSASAISMARESRTPSPAGARRCGASASALQKLHGDERAGRRARRSRGWCRCWDGSGPKRLVLRGESVPAPAGLGPHLRAGTSGRRSGRARVSSAL